MQAEAHDTMRRGLSALKDEAAVSHPVELIQGNVRPRLMFALQIAFEYPAAYQLLSGHIVDVVLLRQNRHETGAALCSRSMDSSRIRSASA